MALAGVCACVCAERVMPCCSQSSPSGWSRKELKRPPSAADMAAQPLSKLLVMEQLSALVPKSAKPLLFHHFCPMIDP